MDTPHHLLPLLPSLDTKSLISFIRQNSFIVTGLMWVSPPPFLLLCFQFSIKAFYLPLHLSCSVSHLCTNKTSLEQFIKSLYAMCSCFLSICIFISLVVSFSAIPCFSPNNSRPILHLPFPHHLPCPQQCYVILLVQARYKCVHAHTHTHKWAGYPSVYASRTVSNVQH